MTTPRTLKLAKTLSLPLDFVTKTAAILAQRRKGKTYLASVIAEEMVAAKQPFVALDPTGAWWGLRASADGRHEGLPVVVLGGQHGDVPLERTGGKLIADLVVDEPGYYVIDFSLFESGEAERQFAVDFGERLYRAKGQPGRDFTLHLFIDEADRFIPQRVRKGSQDTSERLLGAFETIVRRGGLRGLGTTLISQRAAVVNKNVLEMLDVLFVLRTIGPNDREAVANYIRSHGTDAEYTEMMGSLASLEIGEAWVWEPGAEPPLFQRVHIRRRRTFNSSATPQPGEKRIEPRRLADVDLAALQERMAATIEKAKAEDPRELRRQIAELKKELGNKQPTVERKQQIVEKPALTDADRALITKLMETLDGDVDAMAARGDLMLNSLAERAKVEIDLASQRWIDTLLRAREQFAHRLEKASVSKLLNKLSQVPSRREEMAAHKMSPSVPRPRNPQPVKQLTKHERTVSRRADRPASGDGALGTMHRKMLTALAQHPDGLTKKQVLVHTGYASSGPVSSAFADLAREGWATTNGRRLHVTDAGLQVLGPFDPLPLGDALREWLLTGDKLKPMEKALLDTICAAYPEPIRKGEVLEQTGYASSGPVSSAFAKLVAYGYAVPQGAARLRAAEELFS